MAAKAVRISRSAARRLLKLLHMKYKPTEVALEMGVAVDTIYRSYLPAGAPYEKDAQGNVWIVGNHFAQWAMECAITNNRKPAKVNLEPDQVYCLKCNQIVEIKNPRKGVANKRGVLNLSGRCPKCDTRVNRFCRSTEWAGRYDQPQ